MIKDFQGNEIHLDKRGAEYPVDALLKEENGKNVLVLSARVFFVPFEIPIGVKIRPWKENILTGFRQWAGHYQVFGLTIWLLSLCGSCWCETRVSMRSVSMM